MNYLRARYYEPGTGQFVTLDPLVASTMSPYAYAGNDSLNGSDPLGLYVGIMIQDAPTRASMAPWAPDCTFSADFSQYHCAGTGPATLQDVSNVAGSVSTGAGGLAATCAGLAAASTASIIGAFGDAIWGPCAVGAGVVSLGAAGIQTAADIGLAAQGKGNPSNLAMDAFGWITAGQGSMVGRCLEPISKAAKWTSDALHNLVGSGIPGLKQVVTGS